MLSITDRVSLASALNDPDLDTDLRTLIELRVSQLHGEQGRALGAGVRLSVVQGRESQFLTDGEEGHR